MPPNAAIRENNSPSKKKAKIKAHTISSRRIIAEEVTLRPFSPILHKKYAINEQNIPVKRIAPHPCHAMDIMEGDPNIRKEGSNNNAVSVIIAVVRGRIFVS